MASRTPTKPRKVNLSPQEERARQVLGIAMRLLGKTDTAVAEVLGKRYQAVQARRHGETRIRMGDVNGLATALDVPTELFGMEPLDAGAWILSNRPDQVIDASGWLSETAAPLAHAG